MRNIRISRKYGWYWKSFYVKRRTNAIRSRSLRGLLGYISLDNKEDRALAVLNIHVVDLISISKAEMPREPNQGIRPLPQSPEAVCDLCSFLPFATQNEACIGSER